MPRAKAAIHIKTRKEYGSSDSIVKRVRSNSDRAAYAFARRVTSGARNRVHVITGELRNSIHHVKVSRGVYRVIVGKEYGIYEEYGTRYRPAHPYFRPAVEDSKAIFHRDMRRVFHR